MLLAWPKRETITVPISTVARLARTSDREGRSRCHSNDSNPRPAHRIASVGLTVFLAAIAFQLKDQLLDFFNRTPPALQSPAFHDVSKLDEPDRARIDNWLRQQFRLADYPSLSVTVVRDGKIAYRKSLGFTNVAAKTPATSRTQYNVASVTKAFTATLAVILAEQGVIDLDDPVSKYLPDDVSLTTKAELGAKITLRHLASHTSGLPRGVPGRVQSVDGGYQLEPKRLYHLLPDVELDFKPGSDESYSNLGFGLLGHALERAAQRPLDQLVQELICRPLELKQTSIQTHSHSSANKKQESKRVTPATGYSSSVPRRERTHSFRERLAGSGGLVASAEDLAMFLAAQMPSADSPDPACLSSKALKQLHTTAVLNDGSPTHRALGWSIHDSDYIGRVLQKNGGRSNCSAWIGFSPEHRIGVAVVTNCGGPDVDELGVGLLERLVPGAHQPVTKYGYAKVAPYTGVRWENNRPLVRVKNQWRTLVSINKIPIDQIMSHAEQQFRASARKRIAEDLPEVLSTMGQKVQWEVTLGLQTRDGKIEQVKTLMTADKRRQVRE